MHINKAQQRHSLRTYANFHIPLPHTLRSLLCLSYNFYSIFFTAVALHPILSSASVCRPSCGSRQLRVTSGGITRMRGLLHTRRASGYEEHFCLRVLFVVNYINYHNISLLVSLFRVVVFAAFTLSLCSVFILILDALSKFILFNYALRSVIDFFRYGSLLPPIYIIDKHNYS